MKWVLAIVAVVLGFAGGFFFAPKGSEVRTVTTSTHTVSYETTNAAAGETAEAATVAALSV